MEQHVYEFDKSVAAEGFRQIQTANEYSLSHEQHDAWLEQFLANARKAFGLPFKQITVIEVARGLEQRGYFGFAHYLELRAKRDCLHMMGKASPFARCR